MRSQSNLIAGNIENEGLESIFSVINDAVQSLPIGLIASMESLTSSMPEYVNPIANSVTLNVI